MCVVIGRDSASVRAPEPVRAVNGAGTEGRRRVPEHGGRSPIAPARRRRRPSRAARVVAPVMQDGAAVEGGGAEPGRGPAPLAVRVVAPEAEGRVRQRAPMGQRAHVREVGGAVGPVGVHVVQRPAAVRAVRGPWASAPGAGAPRVRIRHGARLPTAVGAQRRLCVATIAMADHRRTATAAPRVHLVGVDVEGWVGFSGPSHATALRVGCTGCGLVGYVAGVGRWPEGRIG